MRTTEEDLEEASGRGDREDWFKGGCPETRQMEGRSAPFLLKGQHRIKTESLH